MSNKLKEVMKKEFDKDMNYNSILSKVERVNDMKNLKMKYLLAPAVAFVVLFAIIFGINTLNNPDNIFEMEVALNINEIKKSAMTNLDADIKTLEIEDLPEKFGFIKNVNIPKEYKIDNSYNVYTKSNINIDKYDLLHDYVFNYRKDSLNNITIAFSEIEEPIRDYYIDEGKKISKIGEDEVIISHYNEMYIVTFTKDNIYFDIETVGISQEELVEMLISIFTEMKK